MAERLSSLAFAQQQLLALGVQQQQQQFAGQQHLHNSFSPRSVQLDIRSPEELAAVNEFLIALGRDVTSAGARQQHMPLTPSELSSPSSYFDPAGLSQLGLQNMPGIPSIPSPSSSYGKYSPRQSHAHPSTTQASGRQGSMYPSFTNDMSLPTPRSSSTSSSSSHTQYPQTISIPAALPRLSSSGGSLAPKPTSTGSSGRSLRPSSSHTANSPGSSSGGSADPSPALKHARAVGGVQLTTPYIQQSRQNQHIDSAESFNYLSPSSRSSHQQSLALGGGMGAGQFTFGGNLGMTSGMGASMPPPQLSGYELSGGRPQNRTVVVPLKTAPGRYEERDDDVEVKEELGSTGEQSEEEGSDRKRFKEDIDVKPPRAIEPRVRMSRHRGMPARLTSASSRSSLKQSRSSSSSTSDGSAETDETSLSSVGGVEEGKLYPLLTAGDAQFRLPPMKSSSLSMSGPPSPSSPALSSSSTKRKSPDMSVHPNSFMRTSSPVDNESDGSRTPSPDIAAGSTRLPSLRSLAPELRLPAPIGRGGDLLASGVQRLRLQHQKSQKSSAPHSTDRRQHAELIKNLLVTINEGYRKKFGTPSTSSSEHVLTLERGGDVEMASA